MFTVPSIAESKNIFLKVVDHLRDSKILKSCAKGAVITAIAVAIFACCYGIYQLVKKIQERKVAPVQKETIKKDPNSQNILLLGCSCVGKSALLKVLKDPTSDSKEFLHTKEPELTTIEISGYKLNVMDTPGLFERGSIGVIEKDNKERRSVKETIQVISNAAEQRFGGTGFENVDTAVFTIELTPSLKENDITSLNTFLPKLSEKTKKILVITHAETMTKEWQTSMRSQLLQHSKVIFNNFQENQILFSGALNSDNVQNIGYTLPRICTLRETIIAQLLPEEEPEEAFNKRFEETKKKIKEFTETAEAAAANNTEKLNRFDKERLEELK